MVLDNSWNFINKIFCLIIWHSGHLYMIGRDFEEPARSFRRAFLSEEHGTAKRESADGAPPNPVMQSTI